MPNDYDLSCPQCGQDDHFCIKAQHTITIHGGGIDHDDSLTFENDDIIICQVCSHEGKVKHFQED